MRGLWGMRTTTSFVLAIALAMSTIPHALAQTSAPPSGAAAQGAAAQGAATQGAAAPGGYGQEISPTVEYKEGLPVGAVSDPEQR
jgi:hypothetical protein